MWSTPDGCLGKSFPLSRRPDTGTARKARDLLSSAKLGHVRSAGKQIHWAIEANTDTSDKHRWL
jgi:hypothetical protein